MTTPNFDNLTTDQMQDLIEEVERRRKEAKVQKRQEARVLISEGTNRLMESFGIERDPEAPSFRERVAARLSKDNEDETPEGSLPDPA